MRSKNPRLSRHSKTVTVMTGMYCRNRHGRETLCPDCQALLHYAHQHLEKCPFKDSKPPCAKCPVHCFEPEMRERVREVMRYSGPRMMRRYPVLAVLHLIDGLRRMPKTKAKGPD